MRWIRAANRNDTIMLATLTINHLSITGISKCFIIKIPVMTGSGCMAITLSTSSESRAAVLFFLLKYLKNNVSIKKQPPILAIGSHSDMKSDCDVTRPDTSVQLPL